MSQDNSPSRRRFLQGSLALAGLSLIPGGGVPTLPRWQAANVAQLGDEGDESGDDHEGGISVRTNDPDSAQSCSTDAAAEELAGTDFAVECQVAEPEEAPPAVISTP
jgi:hypothetical protein